MVIATFSITKSKSSLIIEVTGHAGQNDVGKDIICSASSILAFTVAQIISDMHKAGKLKKKPSIRLEDGNATIVVKPSAEYYDEALHTLLVAETGYKLLAHNYPQYVHLNSFDEDI